MTISAPFRDTISLIGNTPLVRLAGPSEAALALEGILHDVLTMPRDPARLRQDVQAMRAEMALHKPPKGPLDAKLLRGGLVDLEFLVHFLQLRDGTALSPRLGEACCELEDAGLVPADTVQAHDFLTRLIIGVRLLAPDLELPDGAAAEVLAGACHCSGPKSLLRSLTEARQSVADAWQSVFDQPLEIE